MHFGLRRRGGFTQVNEHDKGTKQSTRRALRDFFRSPKRKQKHADEKNYRPLPETTAAGATSERLSEKPEQPITVQPVPNEPLASKGVPIARPDSANDGPQDDTQQEPPSALTEVQVEPEPVTKGRPAEDIMQELFAGIPSTCKRGVEPLQFAHPSQCTKEENHDTADSEKPSHHTFTMASNGAAALNAAELGSVATWQYQVEERELPDMATSQGVEPGSVGSLNYKQLSVAESSAQDGHRHNSDEARNQELFQDHPDKLGLRNAEPDMVHERLMEIGDFYEQAERSNGSFLTVAHTAELYANLFAKFLTPPPFNADNDDPTGLTVQVEALIPVLRLEGVWYDFSDVAWRIKIGQILWPSILDVEELENEEDLSVRETSIADRELLMLQILLACELLLRLDILTVPGRRGSQAVFDSLAPHSGRPDHSLDRRVKWGLILARRFLHNVRIVENRSEAPKPVILAKQNTGIVGFFSSVTTHMTPDNGASDVQSPDRSFSLVPRHQSEQLSGLLHFAEKLSWPNLDLLASSLSSKINNSNRTVTPGTPSVYATPLDSPRSVVSNRSSYFGSTPTRRPRMLNRSSTQLSVQLRPSSAIVLNDGLATIQSQPRGPLNIGSWLSRTYFCGLILPGEALSHFLISALLENDALAVASLGESASLYGGFVYNGRSFWSKSCIVARVLAGKTGAAECMGWLSLPVFPDGWSSGWAEIRSKPTNRDSAHEVQPGSATGSEHRMALPSQAEYLRLPTFEQPASDVHIRFHAFALDYEDDADTPMADDIDVDSDDPLIYSASLTFWCSPGRKSSEDIHTISLVYDVQFIASCPCTPPTSALLEEAGLLSQSDSTKASGHPLHVSDRYRLVTAASLITSPPSRRSLGSHHAESPASGTLVIDARGSSDLQVLGRAWCAEQGEDAVIGRAGRTCLACCINEAQTLRVGVVIYCGATDE